LALPLQDSLPLECCGGCRNRCRDGGGFRLVVHSAVLPVGAAVIVCVIGIMGSDSGIAGGGSALTCLPLTLGGLHKVSVGVIVAACSAATASATASAAGSRVRTVHGVRVVAHRDSCSRAASASTSVSPMLDAAFNRWLASGCADSDCSVDCRVSCRAGCRVYSLLGAALRAILVLLSEECSELS
jgi:hypothetical protein